MEVLNGLQARPLAPTWPNGGTVITGYAAPLGSVPQVNDGWPGPILRGFSFAVRPPITPWQKVNIVTGVPTAPGNARRRS